MDLKIQNFAEFVFFLTVGGLQYGIHFTTTKWVSYMYTYIPSYCFLLRFFLHVGPYNLQSLKESMKNFVEFA